MPTGQRRRARTLALQALYEADTSSHPAEEALQRMVEERPEPPPVAEFARRLIDGVREHRDAIDGIISETAPQFPLRDVAVIDRNVLRVAVYEVLFDDETPVRAAVNEAVELAKTFGTESSPRFVNGVLGTVAGRTTR